MNKELRESAIRLQMACDKITQFLYERGDRYVRVIAAEDHGSYVWVDVYEEREKKHTECVYRVYSDKTGTMNFEFQYRVDNH